MEANATQEKLPKNGLFVLPRVRALFLLRQVYLIQGYVPGIVSLQVIQVFFLILRRMGKNKA